MSNARAEWARCRHWIEAAIEHSSGLLSIEDVERSIEAGNMQFWPGKACAAVTEVAVYPQSKHLMIVLAGGNMEEIISMIPSFKWFGAAHGCTKLVEAGRPGWERVLRSRGWKRECVVLSTPIEETTNGRNAQQENAGHGDVDHADDPAGVAD
jgi:hypothetical protein